MNLTLLHIFNAIGRLERSVTAVLCALLCVVETGRNLQPERSGSAQLCSPVRRSVAMNKLHRLGRAMFIGIFMLMPTAGYTYDIDNFASLDFTFNGTAYTFSSNTVTVTVTPPPSAATLELSMLLGDLHERCGAHDKAEAAYKHTVDQAIALDVDLNPEPMDYLRMAALRLARLYRSSGRQEDAESVVRQFRRHTEALEQ